MNTTVSASARASANLYEVNMYDVNLYDVNLYDVLTDLSGRGQREGRCFKFCSPFRDEQSPSFAVYPQTNTWFDFGLGEGGDLVSFFRRFYNCGYREALCEIEAYTVAGATNERQAPSAAKPPMAKPLTAKPPRVKVKPHGTEEILKGMGLPYTSEWGSFIMKKGSSEYLAFPCPSRYQPEGLECRLLLGDGPKRMTIGKKSIWRFLVPTRRYLVTESIVDAIAGMCVIPAVSLISLNSVSNWEKGVEFLNRFTRGDATVFLALDNDDPGRAASEKMCGKINDCCRVEDVSRMYKGHKDFYRYLQHKTNNR